MSAIFHDSGVPSFFAPKPSFSFHDLAEVVELEPYAYKQRRMELEAMQGKFGIGWQQRQAVYGWELWRLHRPWWLT